MSPVPQDNRDDLSALAWVHDELRRSLDAAHKALRRFVKETEVLGGSDVDAVDPAVLRNARSQIHQGVGALELVGQPAAAMVLRASEALVQRFVAKPHKLTSLVVDDIERASFALLDYLTRLLADKPVSTLSLFPQYRAVQEAAGADRVHPADLWVVDWQWRDLPADPTASPRPHDAATHAALEAQLLPLMRASNPLPAALRMSELCAGLGAGASQAHVATLWKLAAAVFEAQSHGLLGFDVFSKRVASRLLAQYRILERGESEVSERLAQDLLFFCAQSASPGDGRHAPRLAAVRQAYTLAQHAPTDYSVSVLGRFDPAVIAQARKRVAAAKEAWSAVAGGEMHRLTGLSEQFALVGESLKRLFPLGDLFATELQQAVAQTQQGGSAPPAPLAMEVATSLLYIEAALEDADFDHPAQAERVRRLAERLAAVRAGRAPEPLEGWMEELYRRVSDRQTMGSVVQELRASLSESEKLIDQYFRKPEERQVLIPVPNQLSAMRGVLSVLGMDHAAAALLRMRDEVDALAATEVDTQSIAQTGVFDRLAGNLGALGFLIDMLSVQPQMAKSLFTYDAAAGTLEPVMGRAESPLAVRVPAAAPPVEQRLIEQAQMLAFSSVRQDVPVADVSRDLERLSHEAHAADQPALAATVLKAQEAIGQAEDPAGVAAARGELSEALVDFVATASDPVGIDVESAAARVSTPMTLDFAPAPTATDLAQDDEMREVFLEEAREVLAEATSACGELAASPGDLTLLTTLRRAFHTLKGSSRMVGLKDFGEAAWACEQLYNTQLADPSTDPQPLLDFTGWCLGYLSDWVGDISAQRPTAHDAATVIAAAQRVGAAPDEAPRAPPEAGFPALAPDLPAVAEPAWPAIETASEPAVPAGTDAEPAELAELSFELDLAGLDGLASEGAGSLVSAHAPLDTTAAAFQDPFDLRPIELPRLAETVESSASPLPDDAIDLDLEFDVDAGQTPSLVETIAPSARMDLDLGLDAAAPQGGGLDDEQVKLVGPLRIGIPLFNIYLNEADELSRRLTTDVAEWAMELHRPIGDAPIALAHSLAGSSATVGFADLSQLARALEHAQARSLAIGQGTPEEARLFVDAAEEIRRLLHQFAAGFLKQPAPELMARLADHELSSARRLEAAAAAAEHPPGVGGDIGVVQPASDAADHADVAPQVPAAEAPAEVDAHDAQAVPAALHRSTPSVAPELAVTEAAAASAPDSVFGQLDSRFDALGVTELKPFGDLSAQAPRMPGSEHALVDADDVIDAVDAVDAELFPIFEEEAGELLPQLASRLRDWVRKPGEAAHPAACMRTLHTLKGGARLAGAMRLGEMAHRLETRIERLLAHPPVGAADVETLQIHGDALSQTFEALRSGP
ncbi:MAG: Hpt domain-containing protein, partial [Burkholderiales bacterium]|nr:Hpt domain-containing protein [Burkholderiales bacterium]